MFAPLLDFAVGEHAGLKVRPIYTQVLSPRCFSLGQHGILLSQTLHIPELQWIAEFVDGGAFH